MRESLADGWPLLAMLGTIVLILFGFGWYYHDLSDKCIAAGMQWVNSSCVR